MRSCPQGTRRGNAEIDGEALDVDGRRVAIEVKTLSDDVVRGLGPLAEASAFSNNYERVKI